MRWRLAVAITFIGFGLLFTYWPMAWQPWLEQSYGQTLYPFIQQSLSKLTAPNPFTLSDVLWLALPAVFLLRLYWLFRANIIKAWLNIAIETLLWLSAGYLLLMLMWGLNYQRPSLYKQLQEQGFTTHLHQGYWQFALEQTNITLSKLPTTFDFCGAEQADFSFDRPAALMHSAMSLANLKVSPSRSVKPSAWSFLYGRLATAGVYIPFTGEPTFNKNTFSLAQPFIMTHEFGHWTGAAREYDADILAYWSMWLSPDPHWQYSAWLVWWKDIKAPMDILIKLPEPITESLQCYNKHLRAQPRWEIRHSFWSLYEANLHNQGVSEGLKSYSMGEAMALSSYQDWLHKKTLR